MIEKNQSESTDVGKTENDDQYICDTSSFRLRVSFKQKELTVTIEDLVDFVVYSKVYTEGDIGRGEIHQKVLLEDIFYSLTQSDFGKGQVFVLYEFGTLVHKDSIPYFQIQPKGNLKVLHSIMELKRKENICYESSLQLTKVREMSEVQIMKESFALEKKKVELKHKEEIDKLMQELQLKNKELKQIKKANLTFFQLDQRILNLMKSARIIKKYSSQGYEQSIIHEVIPFQKNYYFKVRIINGSKGNFGIGVVDYSETNTNESFRKNGSVSIYRKSKSSDWIRYPDQKPINVLFLDGEVLEVNVSLANRQICWSANGVKFFKQTDRILQDKNRIFVPYVEIYHEETELRWDMQKIYYGRF